MCPRDVSALRVFLLLVYSKCARTYHLVSIDREKAQDVCFQKTDGRGQVCSRLASMRDDEPRLTSFTLTERVRA